eukprot:g46141.t1
MNSFNGQLLHLRWLQGKVPWGCGGMLGVKKEWTRVCRRDWSLLKADKEGEHVTGSGISLAPDDLLDVDAGGMVGDRDNWGPCKYPWPPSDLKKIRGVKEKLFRVRMSSAKRRR